MSGRKGFLSQPAPENYVAGLGRGATGFTTRSDLGPAREGPSEDQIKEALAKRAQQLGAAPPTAYGATEKKEEDNDDDERFQDPENETGLFANGQFDRDDDEADRKKRSGSFQKLFAHYHSRNISRYRRAHGEKKKGKKVRCTSLLLSPLSAPSCNANGLSFPLCLSRLPT